MRRLMSVLAVCVGAMMLGPAIAQQDQGSRGQGRGIDQDPPRFQRHGPARVPNHYIVVLDEDAGGTEGDFGATSARAEQVLARSQGGGRMTYVYAHALRGFAAEMSEEDALALSQDPDVLYVEEDSIDGHDIKRDRLDHWLKASRPLPPRRTPRGASIGSTSVTAR